jgi:hypothetical protein
MKLTNNKQEGFVQPPEGVHNAICVDVLDLGQVETDFGLKHKVRVVFEMEACMEDGRPFTISKSFNTSLHPKATLNAFLSKWRGKPIAVGETVDLDKLKGVCATLVLGAWQNGDKEGVGIDAVMKPTKKITASGQYDPVAARQRLAEKQKAHGQPRTPSENPNVQPADDEGGPF